MASSLKIREVTFSQNFLEKIENWKLKTRQVI